MLGTEENPGNMFHTLKELFMKMKDYKLDREFKIRVSFLEIYNEQIRDLIVVSPEFLDLREDPLKGLVVAGLSEIEVRTPEEILNLLMYSYTSLVLTVIVIVSAIVIEHRKRPGLMKPPQDHTPSSR